jgi:AraC-like DNA-binding protein
MSPTVDGQMLPHFHFSSSGVNKPDSFALWQQARSALFAPMNGGPDAQERFSIDVMIYNAGPMIIGGGFLSEQQFCRTPETIQRDGLDHFLLLACKTGGFSGDCDGKQITMDRGDVGLFSFSAPADTKSLPGECIGICLPRTMLASLLQEPNSVSGTILTRGTPLCDILYDHMVGLLRNAGRMRADDAANLAQSCAAMIAVCFGPSRSRTNTEAGRLRNASLVAMRRFVEANLMRPDLDAELLVKTFAVSRATLYRQFTPLGGVSEFIRKRRLRRAVVELMTKQAGKNTVDSVATRLGFSSAIAFSRSFKMAYGFNPSDIQRNSDRVTNLISEPGDITHQPVTDWLYDLS